ncbi:craniofacial development protein 2-like [Trachemys scripta elegans]|uniref:craniofacial development protein 2-like n=1 Tax=Trachemys scripta elegans TaxID=31138 RepID=UPI0015522ADC|nr:craniofacial development protein 2-like [Trachemys scripta elegans]
MNQRELPASFFKLGLIFGNTFLGRSFDNKARTGGIGFIVKKEKVPRIVSCDIISPWIAVLMLQTKQRKTIKIIQVYAPMQQVEDEEMEHFYEELEEVMQKRSTYTVIQGDFNAIVGGKESEKEKYVGKFGKGVRNDHRACLVAFTEVNHLHTMNTIFQKEDHRHWTWKSLAGVTLNQIDYVMMDTRRTFNDVATIGEQIIFTGSDHYILRSKLCVDNVYED